ncbi:MAG: polyamine ABC transporter ATP-binding protein [Deltaproteobacteria bacterium HGW-Deltaproteobacteria-11]|nr:MAG: polyamine ABC transporter ATP-binding protein [Deltaproteobacteria bacterium HGW-Deltaproteobacteria-11]
MGFGDNLILQDVGFEVAKGEIFVIVGGSGCGKTVLMKNMIGLYRPSAGRVRVEGMDINSDDEDVLNGVRKRMGVLFQSSALIGSMTLAENVALPLSEQQQLSPALVNMIVRMKLGLVNLAGYGNHLPAALSGGMKKRAGLARAMVMDPTILFFDEPSSGLDPVTAAELDVTIKGINEGMGTTMVIVSHDLSSIMNIAHRVIMLDKDDKGIIAEGVPAQLKENSNDPRVIHFFNRSFDEAKAQGAIHGR